MTDDALFKQHIADRFNAHINTIHRISDLCGRGRYLKVTDLDGMTEDAIFRDYTPAARALELLQAIASMNASQQEDPAYIKVLTCAITNLRSIVETMAGETFSLAHPARMSPEDWKRMRDSVEELRPNSLLFGPDTGLNFDISPEYIWYKRVNSCEEPPQHPAMFAGQDDLQPVPWDLACKQDINTGKTRITYLYPGNYCGVGDHGNISLLVMPSRASGTDYTASNHDRWIQDLDLTLDHRARAFMLSFLRNRMKRVDSRANWRLDHRLRQAIMTDLKEGGKYGSGIKYEGSLSESNCVFISEDLAAHAQNATAIALDRAEISEADPTDIDTWVSDGAGSLEANAPQLDRDILMLLDILEENQVIDLHWLVPQVWTDRAGVSCVHPSRGCVQVASASRFLIEAVLRNVQLAVRYFSDERAPDYSTWNTFVVEDA